jgi:putative spermidine/putrescine transport system ATP-binding protein
MNAGPVTDTMVELDGIAKAYGGTQALHPTRLSVRRGEFLTLLGPSGSGKTTLLNIIAGMISPSTGRILIDGRDVTSVPPAKRGIGMVFQNYALMPHMTVFRNVAFPLEVRGVSRDEIRRRVGEVLALVRLPHVADRKPKELSGGQQQRVSIARCMVYNPSLILMDEPLGALDKSLREKMQLEIKRLHAQSGITMIYVTHDQDEALNMSDRIMLMNAGAIEQIGTPEEMYAAPVSRFAAGFLGHSTLIPGEITAPGVARLACGTTVRVHHGVVPGAGHLLLRPENVRIDTAGETLAPQTNRLEGVLSGTLVTAGVVKHFVTLDDGTVLVVQELANERRTQLGAGTRVTATWSARVGLFLNR